MLPKLNGHEKMFLHCPKYNEHVEAIIVCMDCSYSQGFFCPKVEQIKKRLDLGEVTEEYLENAIEEYQTQPKQWAVQCAFPVFRPCNSMLTEGGEDQWQQQ